MYHDPKTSVFPLRPSVRPEFCGVKGRSARHPPQRQGPRAPVRGRGRVLGSAAGLGRDHLYVPALRDARRGDPDGVPRLRSTARVGAAPRAVAPPLVPRAHVRRKKWRGRVLRLPRGLVGGGVRVPAVLVGVLRGLRRVRAHGVAQLSWLCEAWWWGELIFRAGFSRNKSVTRAPVQ